MRVNWTAVLEERLLEVVEKMERVLPRYTDAGKSKAGWWDAVAGAYFTETGEAVTGDSVRKRWSKIRAGIEENKESTDAWERTAKLVEEYESSMLEDTYALVVDMVQRVAHVEHMLKTVCHELGVETR